MTRLRAEAEVADRATRAADPVLVRTADARVLIVVVGVVGPHLHRLVHDALQHGGLRVGVLEEAFEPGARETREVAIPLGLRERILRHARELHRGAGGLERVAVLFPRFAADDAGLRDAFRREPTQLQIQCLRLPHPIEGADQDFPHRDSS